MPSFNIIRKTPVPDSFRAARVCGMFDIPSDQERVFKISGNIDLEFDWGIGLIYGSSGSGKSTIAKELFDQQIINGYQWQKPSVIDDFSGNLSVDQIIESLTSVGLSSPPAWLLPYSTLSNGQQFRATLARAIAENDFVVFDEFTSVVDRIVAKATSVSVNKYIKRTGKKFVAVSCHSDIREWLQPDWTYDTDTGNFARDCLCRPQIEIKIIKGEVSAWSVFHQHHYMSSGISPTAKVYLAYALIDNAYHLAGMFSTMPAMGMKGWVRGHRTVILPDFQGLGIGNKMIEAVAQHLYDCYKTRFRATTSAPGIVKYRLKRPDKWRLVNGVESKMPSGNKNIKVKTSAGRLITSWVYIPEQLRK